MQKEEFEFIDVAEEPKKTEKKRRRAISQKEARQKRADLCHAAAYCGIVRSSLCSDQDTWDRCVEDMRPAFDICYR